MEERVSLRWSAHVSWLFTEHPYLERPQAAREAGFRLVESAWPGPVEREGLPRALAEQGLSVPLLNCPAGHVAKGERGFINDPSRAGEAERYFSEAVELAVRIGAGAVNVLAGLALPGVGERRQRDTARAMLRALAAEAGARGIGVVLEPLNEAENPGYLTPDPDSARRLLEAAGSENLGLLLDVYHLVRVGSDPLEAIRRHGELIRHVQISDFPGRGQPGTGDLDLREVLSALLANGYRGAIGLEYTPLGGTAASLSFTRASALPVSF
ncbi:MAG: hydroxypyruvate isomerase family protein [Syntrophothermus sp.]